MAYKNQDLNQQTVILFKMCDETGQRGFLKNLLYICRAIKRCSAFRSVMFSLFNH